MGSTVTTTVLPLIAVVTLRATPGLVAALVAASLAATGLGSPLGSLLAERSRRRLGMIVGLDVVRASLVGSLPVLWVVGWLTIPVLIALAGLSGDNCVA